MTHLPSGTVTFLFTDIEGSTRLWQQYAETMPAVIVRHDALLRDVVQAHDGVVFRTVGDAVQAAFSIASNAVAAAIAAQRALAAESWDGGLAIRVRMGVHTGAADVRNGEYLGHTLNRVARLTDSGHGGQILLSGATAELVRHSLPADVALRDLGEHRLKDLTLPEHIYQVCTADLPSQLPPLRTLHEPRTNLPHRRGALLGRERELEVARALLERADVGLVTFTGAGGTGKTSLAIEVGYQLLDVFSDGVWFLPLASITDPDLVPAAIVSVLGLREQGRFSPVELLQDFLHGKRVILILDNFEQVTDAAWVVAKLLEGAPELTVLVTSRIALHLREERELSINPLAIPSQPGAIEIAALSQYAAVQLFVARARQVKPAFTITAENAALVAEICSRLDGLPLAIELAAARIRVLTPQTLLTRLEKRLPLLTGGAHDLPARQQTMEAAIAWSYDLLTEDEQRLYRRLCVFSGPFTLEQAETVCRVAEAEIDMLEGLTSMVDKSIVRQEEIAGEPRFSMLQTIREYGLARLDESGEGEALLRRHATFFADLAESLEREAWAFGPSAVKVRADAEQDNVRAALEYSLSTPGDTPVSLRLISALTAFWAFGGRAAEGYAEASTILARPDVQQYPDLWAGALLTMGALEEMRGDSDRAVVSLEMSERLLRRAGDNVKLSGAVQFLGMSAISHGDADEALRRFSESRDLARAENLPWTEATALSFLAEVMVAFGDLDEVRSIAEEAEKRYQDLRDLWGMARMEKLLAGLAWVEGDYATAHRICEKALGPLRAVGERWNLSRTLTRMGIILLDEGLYDDAEQMFMESLVGWRDLANEDGMVFCVAGLAAVAAGRGDMDRAHRLDATEQLRRSDVQVHFDTLSEREFNHVMDLVRAALRDGRETDNRVVSLGETVRYALEASPVAHVR